MQTNSPTFRWLSVPSALLAAAAGATLQWPAVAAVAAASSAACLAFAVRRPSAPDATASEHRELRSFQATLTSLTDGVALFGSDNKALIANAAMERMTGLPPAGFLLSELARLFRDANVDLERSLDLAVRTRGTQKLLSVHLAVFTYNIFVTPVLDADGTFLGAAVILNDVTELEKLNDQLEENVAKLAASLQETEIERTKLSNEKRKFETLIQSIGDGVIAIDRGWNVVLWNRAAERLTGWTAAEVAGKPFRNHVQLLREKDRTENIEFLEEAMLKGEVRSLGNHTVLIRKDGTEMPVGDSAAPVFGADGQVEGAIVVFRDASPEREAQRVKEDFLFSTVHDLRTPASIIKLSLALMEEEKMAVGNPMLEQQFKHLREADERLLQLIQGLLDSAKQSRGFAMAVTPVDLGAIIGATLENGKPLCAAMKLECSYEPPADLPQVSGDRGRLLEVFENLVSNATKYNRKGGTLKITHERDGRFLKTTVQDSGIGIAPENLAKVFTPYFRELQDPKVVGTGLGMFIVKKMVEMMGGTIAVTSVKGQGTAFTVSLLIAE